MILSTLARRSSPFVYSSPKWGVSHSRLLGRSVASQSTQTQLTHLPTNEESNELIKIRHTSAHVMAMAVQKKFPNMQVATGPWIDNGFYYDFFSPGNETNITEQDLKEIKKTMVDIIKKDLPMVNL